MKNKMKYHTVMPAALALHVILGAGLASAHLSYTGRDFGTFQGGSILETKPSISITNISSSFGWAASTDANYGDTHRTRAFRFQLANAGIVTLSVQSNSAGFLPGFSIYSGLAHLAPTNLAHDSSQLSLELLGDSTKVGSLFGLGSWSIGNDPVYNTPGDSLSGIAVPATPRSFSYMGNAADGTSLNYGNASGIQGDGMADGWISGTFTLPAGDYSIFLGGADIHSEGPPPSGGVHTSYASTLTLSTVPEPSSSILLVLAFTGFALRRKRNG
jgi:hypothetical protein